MCEGDSPDRGQKHAKPRILLVDMPDDCSDALLTAGYNVSTGSFGKPSKVESSGRLFSVSLKSAVLPDVEDQEVIFLTTVCLPAVEEIQEGLGPGVDGFWQSAVDGDIDPRPLQMLFSREAFGRVVRHGGIVVAMLSSCYDVEYIFGAARAGSSRLDEKETIKCDNWRFLDDTKDIRRERRKGSEISFDLELGQLSRLLRDGAQDARYSTVIAPESWISNRWLSVAKNKYGEDVAAILLPDENTKGHVLLLPQMPNLSKVLVQLVERCFSHWSPGLFPYHEGLSWLHSVAYEIPEVNACRKQIAQVQAESEKRVQDLEEKIETIRSANPEWYCLLNGTGESLVKSVIHSLERLGFEKVIDVDLEEQQKGNSRALREDIRIHDELPVLVVDVKGIFGCPEDAEATQSEKHALMRTRDLDCKVKPLTIINHERNLPPHERNPVPYRKEIVANAEQTGLGLMTTWDLFCLLRNAEKHNWPSGAVKAVFYRDGRIEPIPGHYVGIGKIVHVWQDAFGVVPSDEVSANSRVAVRANTEFVEFVATSLQVDGNSVDAAPPKSNCGIEFQGASGVFKKGWPVFLVRD